ncbi:MAG: hypothetical protein EAY75_02940 [Bacteroidetes bacterium]|nr:MAG: hypothetical protein EAY75_02940 [Bacteroidota bacterium]
MWVVEFYFLTQKKLLQMAIKFFTALGLCALLAFVQYLYGDVIPWWGVAVGAFLVALAVPIRPGQSWLAGFLGVFLCWLVLAWQIDAANGQLLSAKIAAVLPLGGKPWALLLLTATIGGLAAAFAALSGSYLRGTAAKKY